MSTKTASGSSKSRNSTTSRVRKNTSSRTKVTRLNASPEQGDHPSEDVVLPDDTVALKARKTTRRRSAAVSTTEAPTPVESPETTESSAQKTPKTRKRKSASATSEEAPPTRARRKRQTAVPQEEEGPSSESHSLDGSEVTPLKRKRRTKKAATSPASEAVDPASPEREATEAVKPRRRTTRKKISPQTASIEAEHREEDNGEASPPPSRTRRTRTKKTARTADPVAETLPQESTHSVEALAGEMSLPAEQEPSKNIADSFFHTLKLSTPILRAIEAMGYTHPTPIQEQAIPEILEGWDVLGVAQTGTGKTASFTLPLLEKLSKSRGRARMPRSLILEPTRELALQVADNFEKYGKYLRLNHALLIGGESMSEQREKLNRGVDVLIATPGRLLDLFDRGGLLLTQTDMLVIDEADRMLDMGFIPDIERIVGLLPWHRQTLFFSATMAPEIRRLADKFLSSPREITVARESSVASTITERLFLVEKRQKPEALLTLVQKEDVRNAIIFCNRKRDVDMIQSFLSRRGLSVGHLHGGLTQSLRFSTLERFRTDEIKILVCSDIAARGIDIGGLSYVFNYDLPFNAEDYVHRIGRTGRAGKEGCAFSLATPEEQNLLEAIEALTKKKIERGTIEGFPVLDWQQEEPSSTASRPVEPREPRQKRSRPARQTSSPAHDEGRGSRKNYGLLPPVPEKDTVQRGFGDSVPAFMKISFRPDPRDD